jgi:phosphoserine phosphatase RsbX
VSDSTAGHSDAVEWGVAGDALAGEDESGDRALIADRQDGTLAAVIDGLGHGEDAAVAARLAVEVLAQHADDDLDVLVRRCHDAMRKTRGAVLALAVVRADGSVTWTGVGNVEAVIVRHDRPGDAAREHALLLGGVVGLQIPRVRPSRTHLEPGDELILATDGIARGFLDTLTTAPAQRMADDILRRHATGRDDALVLVARYRGSEG